MTGKAKGITGKGKSNTSTTFVRDLHSYSPIGSDLFWVIGNLSHHRGCPSSLRVVDLLDHATGTSHKCGLEGKSIRRLT